MARVRDGQADFTGGMNDRLAPERLGPTQYALGKNVETRYGGIRSRRGSWLAARNEVDEDGAFVELTGCLTYNPVISGEPERLVYSKFDNYTGKTSIYRTSLYASKERTKMETPSVIEGSVGFDFIQAYNLVYGLRDGEKPIVWNGQIGNAWTIAPSGISGEMPLARSAHYAYNRLWLIVGDDTLIPSDLLSPNWDSIDNEFRVESGDGSRLIAVHKFSNGNLIAFKERSIAVLSGASNFVTASDMTMQFIDGNVGCVAKNTVVPVGADVFFLGRGGVWTIAQTSEQNAMLVEIPLSDPIHSLISDIDWRYVESSNAVLYDNYYILAVPAGGSTTPNVLLAFDVLSRTWVGSWEYEDIEQANSDNLFRHFCLSSTRATPSDSLVSIGHNGAVAHLLRGDTADMQNSLSEAFIDSSLGIDEFQYMFGRTCTDFTDGTISVTVRLSPAIAASAYTDGAFIVKGDISISLIPAASGVDPEYRQLAMAFAGAWVATTPLVPILDGKWHTIELSHNGTQLDGFTFDDEIVGYDPGFTFGGSDFTKWISSVNSALTTNVVSCGEWPSATAGGRLDVASFSIATQPKGNTGNLIGISWALNEGNSYTAGRYFFDNAPAGFMSTEDPFITNWGTDGLAREADIVSVVKTRGMLFGNILQQKSSMRGEVRFSHAQPSVTAELSSDIPFDTEVFSSLNAKTYSLTDYEVSNKAAWSSDNANDDFATPFREDYAPVPLGVLVGDNGIPIDTYREHTELFSSLATLGWAQLTLTNTQGYIRYNALQIEAQTRDSQQDTGNQQ